MLDFWFILQKIQAWVQLPDGNWELGTVLQTTGNDSVISLPEGKVSKNLAPLNVFPKLLPCILH